MFNITNKNCKIKCISKDKIGTFLWLMTLRQKTTTQTISEIHLNKLCLLFFSNIGDIFKLDQIIGFFFNSDNEQVGILQKFF